jgi:uncharacterized protein (TIGR01370 family)
MSRALRALVYLISATVSAGLASLACVRVAMADPDTAADSATPLHSIAFYYGAHPPVEALAHYDVAVVEPDHGFVPPPRINDTSRPTWYAYVSIGEINPSRTYFGAVPSAWLHGTNDVWHSSVVDQTSKGWPEFVVNQIVAPLWRQGYRGFFLDTLDSYQLVATSDEARHAQQTGLVAVIQAIHTRFPGASLILNRGFELLPQTHEIVDGVALESLFRGWDQQSQRYVEVASADREWLLAQVKTARDQYGLPVISIDYCDPADTACVQETMAKIRALGIVPYIGDGGLQTLGAGLPDH